MTHTRPASSVLRQAQDEVLGKLEVGADWPPLIYVPNTLAKIVSTCFR